MLDKSGAFGVFVLAFDPLPPEPILPLTFILVPEGEETALRVPPGQSEAVPLIFDMPGFGSLGLFIFPDP